MFHVTAILQKQMIFILVFWSQRNSQKRIRVYSVKTGIVNDMKELDEYYDTYTGVWI